MLAVVEALLGLEQFTATEPVALEELPVAKVAFEEHAGVLVPSVKLGGVN